jgi:chromosome segregation ATPase
LPWEEDDPTPLPVRIPTKSQTNLRLDADRKLAQHEAAKWRQIADDERRRADALEARVTELATELERLREERRRLALDVNRMRRELKALKGK